MAAFGIMQALFMVSDLHQYGLGNPRWAQSLSLAVACLAAIPLEESRRKGVSWRQQLRTVNGALVGVAFVVFLGLSAWIVIAGQNQTASSLLLKN